MSSFKPYDQLTFSDDFLFCKILQDEELCKEVIKVLLDMDVKKVELHNKQQDVNPSYDGKGIRLDVYLENSDSVFDLEMQTVSKPDLGLRTRYYQSIIDMEHLDKGQDYQELKKSFILFICKQNPFSDINEDLPVYTFINTCKENRTLTLNDKAEKRFYNASAYLKENNKELKAFLNYICNGKSSSSLTAKIEKNVDVARQKEKWRSEYMTWNLAYQDLKYEARNEGRAEGIIEGREEAKLEAAVTAVTKFKIPVEVVAENFNVSLENLLKKLEETNS